MSARLVATSTGAIVHCLLLSGIGLGLTSSTGAGPSLPLAVQERVRVSY